jgi:DNA polymerase-3 subunit alpha
MLGDLPDGTVTTIIGMISTVKKITTKRSGETMAFVTVEGLEGQVEMLCFPSIYSDNRELLVEDRVVKIKGRVDHKDEAEIKFIPLAIEPFTPKTGLEPVALRVDGESLPHTVIDDLKNILVRFPGPCQVEMHVKHGDTSRRLRFGDGFKVDPHSSLFAELKALLGESSVCQLPSGGMRAAPGTGYGAGNGNGYGAGNGNGNGATYSGRNGFGTGK